MTIHEHIDELLNASDAIIIQLKENIRYYEITNSNSAKYDFIGLLIKKIEAYDKIM